MTLLGVEVGRRVRPSLFVLSWALAAGAPDLFCDDRLTLAGTAYRECKQFFERGEYQRAESQCEAAKSALRGGSPVDAGFREFLKEVSNLLAAIRRRRPTPIHATVVFPVGAPAGGPGKCESDAGCQATFQTRVVQTAFPGPGQSALLLPRHELEMAVGLRYEDSGSLVPAIAVRAALTNRIEVGFSGGNKGSDDGSQAITVDTKIGILPGHGLLPTTSILGRVGESGFLGLLAQQDLGKQIDLRYSAGRLWQAGSLRPGTVHHFQFGEVLLNPNKERGLSLWDYSAAVDFPLAKDGYKFRGTAELYGGFAHFIRPTHVFNGGVAYTRRALTLQVTAERSISNYPWKWSVGAGIAYRLHSRSRV